MIERIEYLDQEKMKISFSSLIIRIEGVNKKFGSLSRFVNKFDLWGVTNGKIFILVEMMEPPYLLIEKVQNEFSQIGLKETEDFIYAFEQALHDIKGNVSPLINGPHPDCKNIFWLESQITTDGNFIWYKK